MDAILDLAALPDAARPLALVVLALVDSTSVGTLVIPVILLVTGEGRAGRVAGRTLLYLAVIGTFYFLLGVALLAGLLPLAGRIGPLLASAPAMVVLAVLGAAMVWWSYRIDPATVRKRGGDPEAGARRWTTRARRAASSPRLLAGLALLAGVLEAVSMIPYLAAMGLLAQADTGLGVGSLALLGYCAVMVLPAAVLCGIRALLGERGDRVLDRVHGWSVRHAASAFSWAVGILGVLVLVNTAGSALDLLIGA